MPLLELINALIHDREVRRRFNASPLLVAKTEFGLDGAQLGALFSMKPAAIATEIGSQLAAVNFAFMDGEFPPCSHFFHPDPNTGGPEYPSPTPEIFRIVPKQVSAGAGDFELAVYGQSFSPDARVVLTPKAGGGNPLVVTNRKVFGTFRCSEAYGLVTAPAVAGEYAVKVVNAPTSPTPTDIPAPAHVVLKFT